MLPSTPRPTTFPTLTRYCFTYFYMKTWICPNLTYFDYNLDVCSSCSVSNCVTCHTLTSCSVCDTANGYVLNVATGQCQTCTMTGCLNCSTTTSCLTCNPTSYVLSNQTCHLCDSLLNYFPDVSSQTCILCNLTNCINCSSLTQCNVCDYNHSYYLGAGNLC